MGGMRAHHMPHIPRPSQISPHICLACRSGCICISPYMGGGDMVSVCDVAISRGCICVYSIDPIDIEWASWMQWVRSDDAQGYIYGWILGSLYPMHGMKV